MDSIFGNEEIMLMFSTENIDPESQNRDSGFQSPTMSQRNYKSLSESKREAEAGKRWQHEKTGFERDQEGHKSGSAGDI